MSAENVEKDSPESKGVIVILWLLASLVGFGLAGLLFRFPGQFYLGKTLTGFSPGLALRGALTGALAGLMVGALFWLVTRQCLAEPGWWLLSSALGVGLAMALNDSLPRTISTSAIMFTCGIFTGVIQWLHLQHQTRQGLWWILSSLISWYLGWRVGWGFLGIAGLRSLPFEGTHGVLAYTVFGLVFGLIYGFITGATLVQLIWKDEPDYL